MSQAAASRTIAPAELKAALQATPEDRAELALIDVRPEADFGASHLFRAACIPLDLLEVRLADLVPRPGTPVVLCDGGEGLAQTAAIRLNAWGYTNVAVLEGGTPGWEAAGFLLFSGVNVPSKAFGELVEHAFGTPSVSADELKAMLEADPPPVVLDSRPIEEYRRMNIPTGIDVPGAELVYRLHDLVSDPERTVVVNCAGRTRSILGAQSLINAGVPNKVVALRNGTMGWELAGHTLEHGQARRAPDVSPEGLNAALRHAGHVARRYGVRIIDGETLEGWQREATERTLYLLDVRQPEEFAAGHLPGSRSAPGGQLVQATDEYMAAWGARVVLIDDTGVRATLTASWLLQMGWDVAVLHDALTGVELENGPERPATLGLPSGEVAGLTPEAALKAITAGQAAVVDLADSRSYRRGHVPGAVWATRSGLGSALGGLPNVETLILTSPDGRLARVVAPEAATHWPGHVAVLEGGTQAWLAGGLPVEESAEPAPRDARDVYLKPYERGEETEAAMQDYLDWEVALLERIETDGTATFRLAPPE